MHIYASRILYIRSMIMMISFIIRDVIAEETAVTTPVAEE